VDDCKNKKKKTTTTTTTQLPYSSFSKGSTIKVKHNPVQLTTKESGYGITVKLISSFSLRKQRKKIFTDYFTIENFFWQTGPPFVLITF